MIRAIVELSLHTRRVRSANVGRSARIGGIDVDDLRRRLDRDKRRKYAIRRGSDGKAGARADSPAIAERTSVGKDAFRSVDRPLPIPIGCIPGIVRRIDGS